MGAGGFCAGTYWLYLTSPVFYGQLTQVILDSGQTVANVNMTMVQRVVCLYCIRAVLEWGSVSENPPDLDFHVFNVAENAVGGWKPEGCQDSNEVYWDDQRGPKWGGVTLDVDATAGYGPETITFASGVVNGQYYLAVNVYTDGVDVPSATFANDPHRRIVVYIYDSTGLIAVSVPSDAVRAAGASAWWAGTITKAATGYTYAQVNAPISKMDRCAMGQGSACGSFAVQKGTLVFYLMHSQVEKGTYSASSADVQALTHLSIQMYWGGSCSCWNNDLEVQVSAPCTCDGLLATTATAAISSGSVLSLIHI